MYLIVILTIYDSRVLYSEKCFLVWRGYFFSLLDLKRLQSTLEKLEYCLASGRAELINSFFPLWALNPGTSPEGQSLHLVSCTSPQMIKSSAKWTATELTVAEERNMCFSNAPTSDIHFIFIYPACLAIISL